MLEAGRPENANPSDPYFLAIILQNDLDIDDISRLWGCPHCQQPQRPRGSHTRGPPPGASPRRRKTLAAFSLKSPRGCFLGL